MLKFFEDHALATVGIGLLILTIVLERLVTPALRKARRAVQNSREILMRAEAEREEVERALALFQGRVSIKADLVQFQSDCEEAVRHIPPGKARERFRSLVSDIKHVRRELNNSSALN